RRTSTAGSEYYGETENRKYDHYYFNILLFPNGPRSMKLDSLFVGNDWKKVVENATMNFLNANPTIEANCSNPSMYPKIFEDRFAITESGLIIYPEWSYHDSSKKMEQVSF